MQSKRQTSSNKQKGDSLLKTKRIFGLCPLNDGVGLKKESRHSEQREESIWIPPPKNNTKIKTRLNLAFTLAEVLITLGIIGVVAAMTIPTLISNSQEKEFTESLKKFYSDISGAVGRINIETDTDLTSASSTIVRDTLCNHLSCIKTGTNIGIFGVSVEQFGSSNTKYKNYKSSNQIYTDLYDDNNNQAAQLKNGMIISINAYNAARKSFQLYVDTNGEKGPNMFGKDFNMFEIVRNDESGQYRVLVEGAEGTYTSKTNRPGATCSINQSTNYSAIWPCSYYRLYQPDKLP